MVDTPCQLPIPLPLLHTPTQDMDTFKSEDAPNMEVSPSITSSVQQDLPQPNKMDENIVKKAHIVGLNNKADEREGEKSDEQKVENKHDNEGAQKEFKIGKYLDDLKSCSLYK